MSHIHTIIEEWGLVHNFDDITVNYNSTNPTDIHADEEQDNGPDYLQEVGYYDDDEEEENDLTQTIYTDPPSQGSVTQWSQDSQAQISQDSEVIDLEPHAAILMHGLWLLLHKLKDIKNTCLKNWLQDIVLFTL